MYLQIFKNRDQEYVRIAESYRDPETKKPKIRVIQNFGNKEKLLAENPQRYRRTSEKSGPDELGKRTYGSFDGHPTRERVYRARQCSTE